MILYNKMTMRTLGFTLLIFALSACTSQMREQDGGNLTRGEVEFLSSRMQKSIEREFPLIKHKLVNRYVSTLGQSIISRNPEMPPLVYDFRVLRSTDILIFSLPGGVVYLTLGLLRTVENESQLASAIAHELSHQRLGHPLVIWRRKVNSNRGERYLLDFNGGWANNFLGESGALKFEKGMEQEADELSPALLFRAGYDPRLYLTYLELLKGLGASSSPRAAALISLHPPVNERIAWVKNALLKIPPLKDPLGSSAAFLQIKSILQETAKKGAEKQEVQ